MPTGLQLRKRIFAWTMSRAGNEHESLLAPYKQRLLAGLRGDVLEIGPGAGANLAYLGGRGDVRWIGIEPNPFMHTYLQAEAARLGLNPDLRTGTAEHIDAPDSSADAVICTLVLCSVANQRAALREVLRVLRPGGQFVFIEHVAAPAGTRQRARQNAIRLAWQYFADGCQPNRETWTVLDSAGFAQVTYEHFSISIPIVAPHIAGVARK